MAARLQEQEKEKGNGNGGKVGRREEKTHHLR
jgi:hypothetical protein